MSAGDERLAAVRRDRLAVDPGRAVGAEGPEPDAVRLVLALQHQAQRRVEQPKGRLDLARPAAHAEEPAHRLRSYGRSTAVPSPTAAPLGLRGLVHELGEHLGHAAASERGAPAGRAVAVDEHPLDLLERAVGAELAGVGQRQLDRRPRDLGDRSQRAVVPQRRVEPVARGAEARLHQRVAVLPRPVLLGRPPRQRVHERGEARDVGERRLAVHRPHLHRAEHRVQADVPPQERVVGHVPGRRQRLDALDVLVERSRTPPGSPNAATPGTPGRARWPTPSRVRARTGSWPPAPGAAAGALAARCRRGSPSRSRASRRGRAALPWACASSTRASRSRSAGSARSGSGRRLRTRRPGAGRRRSSVAPTERRCPRRTGQGRSGLRRVAR